MKKIIMGLILVLSTSAFAASGSESKTPDMYAPNAGGSEFGIRLLLPTGKVESGPVSTTISGMNLNLGYGYAFSDVLVAYVSQNYANYQWTTEPGGVTDKTTGLGDTKIGVKAVLDYGQNFFYYDVGYNVGLLNKAKSNTTSGESTPVSSRPSIQAMGGIGSTFDSFGVGALLGYNLYQDGDRETESSGVTTTSKNKAGSGLNWKLYAQYQANFKVGFSYSEATVDSYDRTTSGVTSSVAKSEVKAMELYMIMPIGSTSEVSVQLMKPEPKDTAGSTYNLLYLTAGYRMTF